MTVHRQIAERLHRELVARAAAPARDGVRPELDELVEHVVARDAPLLPPEDRAEIRRLLTARTVGLGPLETLFEDPEVDEIMISGTRPVWVERGGRLEVTAVRFATESDLLHAIERMLAGAGRRVDRAEPLCDARLPDGSRVHVALPPLAVDGPAVTIRRFRPRRWSLAELVTDGTCSSRDAEEIAGAVADRRSVLISGGTGAGKTTTLGAIAGLLPAAARIVTVEDTAELRLPHPHVVRLEAQPARSDGRGEVTIRELVRNALRMRPDRIVVGEVRGSEALDMVLALTTGHDGSLSTIHARSPTTALRRLETLCLIADVGLPHAAVARMVGEAIDLVVQQTREGDGRRRITAVGRVRAHDAGWTVEPVAP
ncbi:MAG: ATPase, T2SS/T4P/T4SS family [Patulibacter sp.]